jgi:hypothetical protein
VITTSSYLLKPVIVHRWLCHNEDKSKALLGGCPCALTDIRGSLRVPNARRRADLDLGAWRSLHFIFAEDEKDYSLRSLNGSSTPHDVVLRLEQNGASYYVAHAVTHQPVLGYTLSDAVACQGKGLKSATELMTYGDTEQRFRYGCLSS